MAKKRSTTPSRATKKSTPKGRKNIKKSTPKAATKSRSRTPQAQTTPAATTPVDAVDTTPTKPSKIKRTKIIKETVDVALLTPKSAEKSKQPNGNRKAKGPKRPANKGGKAKGSRKEKK